MIRKIYIKQWLELKPYTTHTQSDFYYLNLANQIKVVLKNYEMLQYTFEFEETDIDAFACFLTSYFEDIISGTNLWNSFVQNHYQLYRKKLPFFDTDEYFDNEINKQDIEFLCWYYLNARDSNKFTAPNNTFIKSLADDVFTVLDAEFEYAPENVQLKKCYSLAPNEEDFYVVRNLYTRILLNSYLLYPDTGIRFKRKILELLNESPEYLDNILLETQDNFVANSCTRLLGFNARQWAAAILGEHHPLRDAILEISPKISALFFYKGQNESDVFLEHIATGRKFNLTKKSFDHSHKLTDLDSINLFGLVRWKDEWWFSGIHTQFEFDPDKVLDERNSVQSREALKVLNNTI